MSRRLYHPLARGSAYSAILAVRVRGAIPPTLAGRLREITATLDPTLRLSDLRPLDELYGRQRSGMRVVAWALALATLSVLLLSAAGIYALMSFTVARRRREIGIRTALGAYPRQIVTAIFSRALSQLAIGVVVGVVVAAPLERLTAGGFMDGQGAVLLPAVSALMLTVGLLAAVGPARRVLRIQPTEALREG